MPVLLLSNSPGKATVKGLSALQHDDAVHLPAADERAAPSRRLPRRSCVLRRPAGPYMKLPANRCRRSKLESPRSAAMLLLSWG